MRFFVKTIESPEDWFAGFREDLECFTRRRVLFNVFSVRGQHFYGFACECVRVHSYVRVNVEQK